MAGLAIDLWVRLNNFSYFDFLVFQALMKNLLEIIAAIQVKKKKIWEWTESVFIVNNSFIASR